MCLTSIVYFINSNVKCFNETKNSIISIHQIIIYLFLFEILHGEKKTFTNLRLLCLIRNDAFFKLQYITRYIMSRKLIANF